MNGTKSTDSKTGKDPDSGKLTRKRTRSAKGLEYDEAMAIKSKQKLPKRDGKPKASRKIIFNEKETTAKVHKQTTGQLKNKVVNSQTNNNASQNLRARIGKLTSSTDRNKKIQVEIHELPAWNQVQKVIDPCFKNVWNKEKNAEKLAMNRRGRVK